MTSWKMRNRIERSFLHSLKMLERQVTAAVGNTTDPHKIVRRLKQIAERGEFKDYCDSLALKLTTNIYAEVNGSWRKAAREASRGSEIYRAIMDELKSGTGDAFLNQIRRNASLIRSFPLDLAESITKTVQEKSLQGMRAAEIAEDLREKYPHKSTAQIDLIARTEVSKTQTALTRARSEKLGIDWYIWRTADDSRVRSSHDHMNGVLVRWSDPPSPEKLSPKKGQDPYGNYHAGDTFNCRCYPEPVVDIDLLTFPMRVYYNGKIQNMSKAQFERIAA